MPGSQLIQATNGQRSREAIRESVERRMRPHIERAKKNGLPWAEKLLEASSQDGFSWNATREGLQRQNTGRLNAETITLSQMASAINLVTTNNVTHDFEDYAAVYETVGLVQNTNKIINEFPEMWADDLPRQVAELEPASKARFTGTSTRVSTYEYALMLSISKRLYDADDVGTIRDQVTHFAENWKKVIDRAFVYKMFRELVPTDSRMPQGNVLGFNGGLVPSTPGQITPQRIQDGLTLAGYVTDPFGEFIVSTPDTLFVDTIDEMNAVRFLTSMYSPTGFGVGSAGYNVDTSPGSFATNILQGRLTVAHSPYVKQARAPLGANGAPAMLTKAKKAQVVLIRKPLTITMETPNAGDSFISRTYNWLGEMDFGTGPKNRRLNIILN